MRQGLVFLCDRYPRGAGLRNLAGVDLLIWTDIRTKLFGLEDPGVVSPTWIFSGRDNYHGGIIIIIYIILIKVEMESQGARPRTGILRLKGSSAQRSHHHYFH